MRNTAIVLLASTFVLSACNKANQARKKLTGEWEVISYVVDGDEVMKGTTYMTYVFDECDAKHASELCSGTLSSSFVNGNTGFEYTLTDDGEQMRLTEKGMDNTVEYTMDWQGRTRVTLSGINKWGFDEDITLVRQ